MQDVQPVTAHYEEGLMYSQVLRCSEICDLPKGVQVSFEAVVLKV